MNNNSSSKLNESVVIFTQQFPNVNYNDLTLNDIQTTDSNLRYTDYKNFKKYIYLGNEKKWIEYSCYC